MKKYTILENAENDVMMVKSEDIYGVVSLYTGCDHSYILYNDGELRSTDGYYSVNYFKNNDARLVVKEEDIKNDKDLVKFFKDAERIIIRDEFYEEDIVLIDASGYLSCAVGKAVDIQHGINTDTIYFDMDDDYTSWGWHSEEEVDAELEHENDQDYPNQQATCLWHLDNGRTIRETIEFFSDDHMNTFAYVE